MSQIIDDNKLGIVCLRGTIKISTFRPRAGSVDEKLVHSTTRPLPPPPRCHTIPHKPSPPRETQDSPRPLDSTAAARTTPRRRVGSGAAFRLSWWKGKRITRRRGLYIYGRPASTAFSLSYARRRFKYPSRRLAYNHQNLSTNTTSCSRL